MRGGATGRPLLTGPFDSDALSGADERLRVALSPIKGDTPSSVKLMQRGRSAAGVIVLVLAVGPVGAQTAMPPETCVEPSEAAREEAQLLYESGRELLLAERWAEAATRLEDAVGLDATRALAHYGLGQARLALQKPREALAAFLDARAAYRCILSSPEARAELEWMREEEEAAVRAAIQRLERDHVRRFGVKWQEVNSLPSPSQVTLDAVRRIHALEQRLDELHEGKGPLPTEPPELAFALGNAYFQSGAPEEAEREFRTALAARPDWGDVHHNLAVVLVATGRFVEAEAELKRAKDAGVPVDPRLLEEVETTLHPSLSSPQE